MTSDWEPVSKVMREILYTELNQVKRGRGTDDGIKFSGSRQWEWYRHRIKTTGPRLGREILGKRYIVGLTRKTFTLKLSTVRRRILVRYHRETWILFSFGGRALGVPGYPRPTTGGGRIKGRWKEVNVHEVSVKGRSPGNVYKKGDGPYRKGMRGVRTEE